MNADSITINNEIRRHLRWEYNQAVLSGAPHAVRRYLFMIAQRKLIHYKYVVNEKERGDVPLQEAMDKALEKKMSRWDEQNPA